MSDITKKVLEFREYYKFMVESLSRMDYKQLTELFHDIEDIRTIQLISDCAFDYCQQFSEEDVSYGAQSFNAEAKEDDDRKRNDDVRDALL